LWRVHRRFRHIATDLLYSQNHFLFDDLAMANMVLYMFTLTYLARIQSIGFIHGLDGGLAIITNGKDYPVSAMTSLRTIKVHSSRPPGHAADQRRFDIQFPHVTVQWSVGCEDYWRRLFFIHQLSCGLACPCKSIRMAQYHKQIEGDGCIVSLDGPLGGAGICSGRPYFASFQGGNQPPFSREDKLAIRSLEDAEDSGPWLYRDDDSVSSSVSSTDVEDNCDC
jgi:hypothetical protein